MCVRGRGVTCKRTAGTHHKTFHADGPVREYIGVTNDGGVKERGFESHNSQIVVAEDDGGGVGGVVGVGAQIHRKRLGYMRIIEGGNICG